MSSSAATDTAIDSFLAGSPFAVAGASASRRKYGNKVLRCYWQRELIAYPVNPNRRLVEGRACYPRLSELPAVPHGVSFITQPAITETIVREAIDLGIRHLWMQPGAESPRAVAMAREAGASVIADGACLLVVLGFTDR